MAISDIKDEDSDKKQEHIDKTKRKRYQIQNTNNFACYQKLRILVSQPKKYFLFQIITFVGMSLFYILTFMTQTAIKQINYVIICTHAILFMFSVFLGIKNPGIVLKINDDFQSKTKLHIPFDRDCKPPMNQYPKTYNFPIKSHFIGLRFCSECLIYKPPRAVHCWICNACITNMDHHCPFIGNCIGKGNYHLFITYIYTFSIMLVLIITQLIILIVKLFLMQGQNIWGHFQIYFAFTLGLFSTLVLIFVGSLSAFHVFLILNNLTTNQRCRETWDTISGNPFSKNYCIKNVIRLIKGSPNHTKSHQAQHFQKDMIKRNKQKTQQYLSQYSSEEYAVESTHTKQTKNKQTGQQKCQQTPQNYIQNTQQRMTSLQKPNELSI